MKELSTEEFQKFLTVERILAQIILQINENKFKDQVWFSEVFSILSVLNKKHSEDIGEDKFDELCEFIFSNKDLLVEKMLDFYEENEISFFPIYIDSKKSINCLGLVLRVINKYTNLKIRFDSNEILEAGQIDDMLNSLSNSNLILEIKDIKNVEIGDIVVYYNNDNLASHTGFIYDSKKNVLSKFGIGFIYITPMQNHFYHGNVRFFRLNYQNFNESFKEKFVPIMNRLKMNKQDILNLIKNIENSNQL